MVELNGDCIDIDEFVDIVKDENEKRERREDGRDD
jgi:hypothetical protein